MLNILADALLLATGQLPVRTQPIRPHQDIAPRPKPKSRSLWARKPAKV